MSSEFPLAFVPGHIPPGKPDEASILFCFWRRELLVTSGHVLPSVSIIDSHGIEAVRTQYLGKLGGRPCFSAELADDFKPPEAFVTRDLRMLFGSLDELTHALAGRAVQIVEWDRSHQYCGACGRPTELSTTDRSRKCPDCEIPLYPRLSPAMIVSVERGDEILLGRSNNFPPGIFSLLAGFVEPGESAEEAVIREVFEETRIVVHNVRYFGSQAWPFPNSLMLGFTADYLSGEVDTSHDQDMESADFFQVNDLPNTFPGKISISQWLLHDFIERKQAK